MQTLILIASLMLGVLPSSTTNGRVEYTAAGGTQFTFSFKTFSTSHIKVYKNSVLQSTGYSVALNANQDSSPGGTVTFTVAPANDTVVRIDRTTPVSQDSVWSSFSSAKSLERDLDRSAMRDQQLQRSIDDLAAGTLPSNADSSALMVTATNSTTPRALRDRFSDTVNIIDFGAIAGDGIDDTTAIQAAIDTGKNVFVPEGTFNFSSITFSTNRQMMFGTLKSVLSSTTDGVSMIKIRNNRVVLRDLAIFNNHSNNVALDVGGGTNGASYSTFINVRLVGHGTYPTTYYSDVGIRFWNSSYLNFFNVVVEKFSKGVLDDGGCGAVTFTDSWVFNNRDGVEVRGWVQWKGGTIAHNRGSEALIGVQRYGTWDPEHAVSFTEDSYHQQRANATFIGTHFEADADVVTSMITVGDYAANGSTTGQSMLILDGITLAWNSAARYPISAGTGALISLSNVKASGYSTNSDAFVNVPGGNFTRVLVNGFQWGVGVGTVPQIVKNFGSQTIDSIIGTSHDEYGTAALSHLAQKRLLIMSTNRTDSSSARLRLGTVKADGTEVDRMTFQSGVDVGFIDVDPAKAIPRLGACQQLSGTGSPESVKSAPVCSQYLRTDGGAGTTLYVKESGGSTSTGWVGK